jgi:heparin binding hemagglutinin HbhA
VIIMAVSLPTAADVRKVREQAAKSAAEQAGTVKTPLLAVLGAGEYAYSSIRGAYANAKTVATTQAEAAQKLASELPAELQGLRGKLTTEELRKVVELWRERAEKAYADLARHGEGTWTEIRRQPQVKQAFGQVEEITGKFDARVDALVDDAHDAAEKALATLTRQTRSVGEKVAVRTQKAADEVAETITEVSEDASQAVAEAGKDAAKAVDEAGDEAAAATRSTSRRAASRTAPTTAPAPKTETEPRSETPAAKAATPAKTAPKAATPKQATRRPGPADS